MIINIMEENMQKDKLTNYLDGVTVQQYKSDIGFIAIPENNN